MADRRLLMLALPLALLALAGCPKPWPNCDSDEGCNKEGHTGVCIQGKCQECGANTDCKPNFVCRSNQCVPKPVCTTDPECPAGQKCRDEKCVPMCTGNEECPKGQSCKDGRCAPNVSCSSNADCPAGQKCTKRGKCIGQNEQDPDDVVVTPDACKLETVRFGFNEHTLTADARKVLERNADCIKSRKLSRLTLAGHADERGTEDYNLHLGQKRAAATKKYLSDLGVEASKLETISFGEERPANQGHDEEAWEQNRRVELQEK